MRKDDESESGVPRLIKFSPSSGDSQLVGTARCAPGTQDEKRVNCLRFAAVCPCRLSLLKRTQVREVTKAQEPSSL